MRRRLRSSPGCRWEQQGVHRGQRGRPRPAAADALEPSAVGTGAREVVVVEQQTVPRLQEAASAPGAASKSGSWTELIMTTEDSRAGESDLLRLLLEPPIMR